MDEFKRMIYHLANGIEEWKKSPKSLPPSLYKGNLMLIKFVLGYIERVPNNFSDLLLFLQEPFKNWNHVLVQEVFPLDEVFLEDDLSLSEAVVDFLREYDSPTENELTPMKNFLIYCRENHYDELYRNVRVFLSTRQHTVIKREDLYIKFYTDFKDPHVKEFIQGCYEPLHHSINHYRVCPHCGWTLELLHNEWTCNSKTVCQILGDYTRVKEFDAKLIGSELLRLKPAIQRFILIPGMQELEVFELLQNYNPTLYPNIDEFDIRIKVNNMELFLDVKDVKNPIFLAKLFNNMDKKQLNKYVDGNRFILVPHYRTTWVKGYMGLLYTNLDVQTSKLLHGKFFTVKGFVRKLRKGEVGYGSE